MKLYVIGDFVQFSKEKATRLIESCDACMLADRAPRIGETYSGPGFPQAVVTKVEHEGKVITVRVEGGASA